MENNVKISNNSKIIYGDNRIRYRSYKTELNPTKRQIASIEDFFVAGIIAYNRFIKFNTDIIRSGGKPIDTKGYFDAIRNGRVSEPDSQLLLKPRYRTTVSKTLDSASKVIKKYAVNEAGIPKYKKNGTKHISYYFSASSQEADRISCERHRINIPEIGWVKIKEKGYLPCGKQCGIISGWIKRNCGRYFVSVLVAEPYIQEKEPDGIGIGIDLNVNNLATVSNGTVFININKTESIQKEKRKLTKYRKRIYGLIRKNGGCPEGKTNCISSNCRKLFHKLDTVYYRIYNIRNDYLNKCIASVVKDNPRYIALETLNVKQMVQDKQFSRGISEEMMYLFRLKIYRKSKMKCIQVRMVDKYYPSSKICHECGYYYKNLSIDEREFICPGCGRKTLRDYNASLNIRDAKKYSVWF